MDFQVAQTGSQQVQVLFQVRRIQWCAGLHGWSTTVHLKRSNCRHEHDAVGDQSGIAALDVEELLHADVRAKARFCDHVISQFQGDPVRDDRAVAMGDVGKWTGMDERWSAFEGLHQGRHDGVLHQHRHRTCTSDILRRDGFALHVRANHDAAEFFAHISQVCCQRQDGHDLARHGDVKAGLTDEAFLSGTLSDGDRAQHAVIGVDNPAPGQAGRIDIQPRKTGDLFRRQLIRIGFVDPELLEAFEHRRCEFTIALFIWRA